MAVTRLSGGLTPGVGSDPRTFPAIFNAAADVIDANEVAVLSQGSAIASQGSAIDAIEAWDLDNLNDVVIGTAVAGQKLVFDGTNWVNLTGYVYVQAVYFTSSGTFSKGDYPWLRAIRVKCVGAGGGGGGGNGSSPRGGGGGAGGTYTESFITDIAGLASSVTVTVGSGGAGGAATAELTAGSAGGSSSFGSLVSGNGGGGGFGEGGTPSTTGTGDLKIPGSGGGGGGSNVDNRTGHGGSSQLGGGALSSDRFAGNTAGRAGGLYGGGASGGKASASPGAAGGTGGNGIVIVELYA
jgi:hypothetical protein